MAQVDMTQALVGFDGNPIPDSETEEEVQLRSVCCNALMATFPNEDIAGEEKLKRFMLAQRITKVDTPDLSAEEITLIKKLVSKAYTTLVSGAVWVAIDPPAAV